MKNLISQCHRHSFRTHDWKVHYQVDFAWTQRKELHVIRRSFSILLIAVESVTPSSADTTPEDAGKAFRANCTSCHQPPDLRFETDRAWLDQIHRTA